MAEHLTLPELTQRTESELDWPLLLQQIAAHAISAPAVRAILAEKPQTNFECACLRMRQTEQALDLYMQGGVLPVENLPDIAELLDRLERGTIASGFELRDVLCVLNQARQLRAVAKEQQMRRPVLAADLYTDPSLERVAQKLASSIEADGTLSDSASPDLARARRKWADARRDVMTLLKSMLSNYSDLLRENYWAERDGRYVLPLRADAHRALDGAVLDSSGSGGTLYVEPRELLPHNNRLRICELDVRNEEQRILRQLTELVAGNALPVRAAVQACIRADVLQALARFGEQTRAHALLPCPEPTIELRAARHPLLAASEQVVENDIVLPPATALVISGPNAGGKTVVLKQVGLFAWMARSGIPLPVGPASTIGWFEPVLCNLGDAQSITSNLSTFSAHVAELAVILDVAAPNTLVLLDEIASGTDPEEGAALAAAVLEALAQRGATILATTHHESLKELATRHPQLRSAAVGFDMESLMPTYRLLPDVAGPSTALAVAARYGLAETVVARARSLIPSTSREREEVLRELHAERSAATELRCSLESELSKQRAIRLELEQTRADFDDKESRELEAKYRDLIQAVVAARSQLAALQKRLKESELDRESLRQAEQQVDAAAHVVAMGSPIAQVALSRHPVTSPLGSNVELQVGTKVFVNQWNLVAEVIELTSRGEARVAAGILRATFAASDLRHVPGANVHRTSTATKRQRPRRRPESLVPNPQERRAPVRVESNTLDLRGMRVDESLDRVDRFVDEMMRTGQVAGYVLHGHGTGALKQAVRQHLRGSQNISDSGPAQPEDGGDAFTIFWLP